jgi:hypothetical protein
MVASSSARWVYRAAVAVAPAQRGGHRERRVQPADQVTDRHADLRRVAALGAGDAHQPGPRLRHDVQPGAVGQRAVLAEDGRGRVDQPRELRRQLLRPEPHAAQRARAQVLHERVGAGEQPP